MSIVTRTLRGDSTGPAADARRFPFRFDPRARYLLALLGVTPRNSWVDVTPRHVAIRFGRRRVTLGTTTRAGVCLQLRKPVAVLLPGRLIGHPAITVTVSEPAELAQLLRRQRSVAAS